MPDEAPSPTLDRELTTNIVAAYVRHNQIGTDQLTALISSVHQALVGLGKPATETEVERTPAVTIRQSVHRDYVVCLDCGWRGQMLKRHLATGHGLSVEQYRVRWTLPREHPITAPSYSERRSGLAKQIGLGRGRAQGLPQRTGACDNGKPASNATAISAEGNVSVGDIDLRAGGASSRKGPAGVATTADAFRRP